MEKRIMIKERQLSRKICKEKLGKILNISIKFIFFFFLFVFVSGCSRKELDVDEFTLKMQEKNYSVVDISDDNINIILAVGDHYQVYYYRFGDESLAQEKVRKEIKKIKDGDNSIEKVIDNGYEKYEIINENVYSVYSRINNTYIYISSIKKYRSDVKILLEYIGY